MAHAQSSGRQQPVRWPQSEVSTMPYEIPPDHFLAQAGPSKHQFALSQGAQAQEPTDETADVDAFDPWAAETFTTQASRSHLMPDTSTLAAADFDVDVRTGFLPPEPPLRRLEHTQYEVWEQMLDIAKSIPLRLDGAGTSEERRQARRWRQQIRQVSARLDH